MGDSDNGGSADVQRMAAAMREQAEEIERLRMELQRTSIRQKESRVRVRDAGSFGRVRPRGAGGGMDAPVCGSP